MKLLKIFVAVVLILSAIFGFKAYFEEADGNNDDLPPVNGNSGTVDNGYGNNGGNGDQNDGGNDGAGGNFQNNNGGNGTVTDDGGLYGEFAGHIYTQTKNKGYCYEMTGKIAVLTVFVDEGNIKWSSEDMQRVRASQQSEINDLLSEARRYGASFSTELLYVKSAVNGVLDTDKHDRWKDDVIRNAGYESYSAAYNSVKQSTGADECVIAFYFNRDGRAFAYRMESGRGDEYIILFAADTYAFAHEMTHVFGSMDLYFPDAVEDAAERLFGESIMINSQNSTVDSLTAYLIGWTDELSTEAHSFLRETAYITKAMLDSEYDIENYTGYVENREFDGGVYTGQLTDGFFDGKGRLEFYTGDVYDGEWSFGLKNGVGTYNWTDGNTYTGDWVRDSMTGKGEMKYSDGTVYSGDWVDGALTGSGTIIYANGLKYTGAFLNGEFNGFGTAYYTDGGMYSGQWVNSTRHGKGTMTWANGDKYTGDFQNGAVTGNGTLSYATGDFYTGAFVDGLLSGYGEYTWVNGDCYKGQWYAGAMNGQGTLVLAGGSVYSGTFSNGGFVG